MTEPDEYRVQWTGSREGWPTPFVHMIAGMVLNSVRMRRHAGENVKLVFAHGDAEGVDKTIGGFAGGFGIDVATWLPDWETHGRAAGPIRNKVMVDEFAPHVGIGLNWNNSAGTRHCVSYMREKGIPVLSIEYTGDPTGEFFPR